jgi:hypothetical protein
LLAHATISDDLILSLTAVWITRIVASNLEAPDFGSEGC